MRQPIKENIHDIQHHHRRACLVLRQPDPGTNLFSENSKGNQCVTVITRDLAPWPGMPQNFRQAVIEVEVKGYPMAEAHALSEAILAVISDMQGEYDTASIRTVQPKQLSCFQHDGTCTHSMRVYFVEGA